MAKERAADDEPFRVFPATKTICLLQFRWKQGEGKLAKVRAIRIDRDRAEFRCEGSSRRGESVISLRPAENFLDEGCTGLIP